MGNYVSTIFFGVILIALLAALPVFIRNDYFRGHRIVALDIIASIVFAVSILMKFTNQDRYMDLYMHIHYACISWLVYGVFLWASYFSKSIIDRQSIRTVVFWFILLDSLSLIATAILQVNGIGVELWYFETNGNHIYIIHTIVCYMIVAMMGVSFIKTVRELPKIYRSKYYMSFICVGGIALLNVIIISAGCSGDMILMVFIPFVVIFYVYTLFIEEPRLKKSITYVLEEESKELVIAFDMNGRFIKANKAATMLLGEEVSEYELKGFCERWNICGENKLAEEFYSEIRNLNKMDNLYGVSYRIIKDEKHMVVAYVFIMRDLTEEEEVRRRQRFISTHDRLTELYNREYFCYRAQQVINYNTDKEYLVVGFFISRFELINDIFGTEIGNRFLRNTAYSLKAIFGDKALYGRLETDKFAICLEKNIYSESQLERMTHSVIQAGGSIFNVRSYFGVYEVGSKEANTSIMCDRAFLAINTIVDKNDVSIAYYNDKIRKELIWEQDVTNELEEAIRMKQFEVYLQPQFNPENNAIFGAEALVRWNHPKKGMISPVDFIPIFEKNGCIAKLDAYMWEQVCATIARWKSEGANIVPISVNISPKDFYHINIRNVFITLTQKYDIEPSLIRLEITESAVMTNVVKQVELIKDLQKHGFVIEMDDFGSGYSSLNALKNIPVDILKLDMKFLGISDNELRSREILRTVVELGHKLSMPVIVEGVEYQEEVDFLKTCRCEAIQGFYYAKPMPVSEFEELMKKGRN